jgi:hypothetical protein
LTKSTRGPQQKSSSLLSPLPCMFLVSHQRQDLQGITFCFGSGLS